MNLIEVMLMRLFDIPVYAFDKDTLNLKVKTYVDKIRRSLIERFCKTLKKVLWFIEHELLII